METVNCLFFINWEKQTLSSKQVKCDTAYFATRIYSSSSTASGDTATDNARL